jgi:branched-chain amino acid transport system ATP-binding protein
MSGNILEVIDLEKHFGGVHVANSINFAMREGEQSAIIGPNGAGKSTFMNLLTGYHRPDAGKVVFDGQEITGMPPHKVVRRGISRAFQVSSIFARMTVGENVRAAVQAQMRATFRLFASARRLGAGETDRVLALCALEGKRDLTAGELAQGDKKRLELAIALAGKPRLLFLDEPTAGLGAEATARIARLIGELKRSITVVMIEHDMRFLFGLADYIYVMHWGQVIAQGAPATLRANPWVQRSNLGQLG